MKGVSEIQDQNDVPHKRLKKQHTIKNGPKKGSTTKLNKLYIRAKDAEKLDWRRYTLQTLNWEQKLPLNYPKTDTRYKGWRNVKNATKN